MSDVIVCWTAFVSTAGARSKETALRCFLAAILRDPTQVFPPLLGWILQHQIIEGVVDTLRRRLMEPHTIKSLSRKATTSTAELLLRVAVIFLTTLSNYAVVPTTTVCGPKSTTGLTALVGGLLKSLDMEVLFFPRMHGAPLFADIVSLMRLLIHIDPMSVCELFPPHSHHHATLFSLDWPFIFEHFPEGNAIACFEEWVTTCDIVLQRGLDSHGTLSLLLSHYALPSLIDLAQTLSPNPHRPLSITVLDMVMRCLRDSQSLSNRLVAAHVHSGYISFMVRNALLTISEKNVVTTSEQATMCCRIVLHQLCFGDGENLHEEESFVDKMLSVVIPTCAIPGGNVHVRSVLNQTGKMPCNFQELNTLVQLFRRCTPPEEIETQQANVARVFLKRHILVCMMGALSYFSEFLLMHPEYLSLQPYSIAMESYYSDQDATMQAQILYAVIDFLRLFVTMRGLVSNDTHTLVSDICQAMTFDVVSSLYAPLAFSACLSWKIQSATRTFAQLTLLTEPILTIPNSHDSFLDDLFVGSGHRSFIRSAVLLCSSDRFIACCDLVTAVLDYIRAHVRRNTKIQAVICFDSELLTSLRNIMVYAGPYVISEPSNPRKSSSWKPSVIGLHYFDRCLDILTTLATSTNANADKQHVAIVTCLVDVLHSKGLLLGFAPAPIPGHEIHSVGSQNQCNHWQHAKESVLELSRGAPPEVPDHVVKGLQLCIRILLTHALTQITSCIPVNRRCFVMSYEWLLTLLEEVAAEMKTHAETTTVPTNSLEELYLYESHYFRERVDAVLDEVDSMIIDPMKPTQLLFLQLDSVHVACALLSMTFEGCSANVSDFLQLSDNLQRLLTAFHGVVFSRNLIAATFVKSLLLPAFETSTLPLLDQDVMFGRSAPHPLASTLYDVISKHVVRNTDFVKLIFRLVFSTASRPSEGLQLSFLKFLAHICKADDNAHILSENGFLTCLLELISTTSSSQAPEVVCTDLPLRTSHTFRDSFSHSPTVLPDVILEALCSLVTSLGENTLTPKELQLVQRLSLDPRLQLRMYGIFRQWAGRQCYEPHFYTRFPGQNSMAQYDHVPSKGSAFLQGMYISPWPPVDGYSVCLWFRIIPFTMVTQANDVVLLSLSTPRSQCVVDVCVTPTLQLAVRLTIRCTSLDETSPDNNLWTAKESVVVKRLIPDCVLRSKRWHFLTLHHAWYVTPGKLAPPRLQQSVTVTLDGSTQQPVTHAFTEESLDKQVLRSLGSVGYNVLDAVMLGASLVEEEGPGIRNAFNSFASALDFGSVNVFQGSLSVFESYALHKQGADFGGDMKESLMWHSHYEMLTSALAKDLPGEATTWLTGYNNLLQTGRLEGGVLEPLAPRLVFSITSYSKLSMCVRVREEQLVTELSPPMQDEAAAGMDSHHPLDASSVSTTDERTLTMESSKRESPLTSPKGDSFILSMGSTAWRSAHPAIMHRPVLDPRIKVFGTVVLSTSPTVMVRRRWSMKSCLRTLGGFPALLWLLSCARSEGAQIEALSIIRNALRYNADLMRWVVANHGYESIAWFLKQPRFALSEAVVDVVLSLAVGEDIVCNTSALQELVFDFFIWARAPFSVQKFLFDKISFWLSDHAFAQFHREVFRKLGGYKAILFHLYNGNIDELTSIVFPTFPVELSEFMGRFIMLLAHDPTANILRVSDLISAVVLTHCVSVMEVGVIPTNIYTCPPKPSWRRELLGLVKTILQAAQPELVVRAMTEQQVIPLVGLLFDQCTLMRQSILQVLTVLLDIPHMRPSLMAAKVFETVSTQYSSLSSHLFSLQLLSTLTDIESIIDVFEPSLAELQIMWTWFVPVGAPTLLGSENTQTLWGQYIHHAQEGTHVWHYTNFMRKEGLWAADDSQGPNPFVLLPYLSEEIKPVTSLRHEEALGLLLTFVTVPLRNERSRTLMLKRALLLNALTQLFVSATPKVKMVFVGRQVHVTLVNALFSDTIGNDPVYLKMLLAAIQELIVFQVVLLPSLQTQIDMPSTIDPMPLQTVLVGLTRSQLGVETIHLSWYHILSACLFAFEAQFLALSPQGLDKVFQRGFLDPYVAFLAESISATFIITRKDEKKEVLLDHDSGGSDHPDISFLRTTAKRPDDVQVFLSHVSDYLTLHKATQSPQRQRHAGKMWQEECARAHPEDAHVFAPDPLDVKSFPYFLVQFSETVCGFIQRAESNSLHISLPTFTPGKDQDLINACHTLCIRMLEDPVTAPFSLLFLLNRDGKRRDSASVVHSDFLGVHWIGTVPVLSKDSLLSELSKDERQLVGLIKCLLRCLSPGFHCGTMVELVQDIMRYVITSKQSTAKRVIDSAVWGAACSGAGPLNELLAAQTLPASDFDIMILINESLVAGAVRALEAQQQEIWKSALMKKETAIKTLDKVTSAQRKFSNFQDPDAGFLSHHTATLSLHDTSRKIYRNSWEETTRRLARCSLDRICLQPVLGETASVRTRWTKIVERWRADSRYGPNFMRGYHQRYLYTPISEVLGLKKDTVVDVDFLRDLDQVIESRDIMLGTDIDEYRLALLHGHDPAYTMTLEEATNTNLVRFPCRLVHAMNTTKGEMVLTARGVFFTPSLDAFYASESTPGFVELLRMDVQLPTATLPPTAAVTDELIADGESSVPTTPVQQGGTNNESDDEIDQSIFLLGRETPLGKTVSPEFDAPQNLSMTMEVGTLGLSFLVPVSHAGDSSSRGPSPAENIPAAFSPNNVLKENKKLQRAVIMQQHRFDGKTRMGLSYSDIRAIFPRRYLLQRNSLEIFTHHGETYFLTFRDNATFLQAKQKLESFCVNLDKNLHPSRECLSYWQKAWIDGRTTNFAYLMFLNLLSGRTFNDLTQYPVFPHVLVDYESSTLILTRPHIYRKLQRPMGAQTKEAAEKARRTYESLVEVNMPPFHHGTHYSTNGGVLHYLVRQQPFTDYFLELNGLKLDVPDRTFHSFNAFRLSGSHSREVIPEFFYYTPFLENSNDLQLGIMQNGQTVNNVFLPSWARGDRRAMILLSREALEGRQCSESLPRWIDLIFGALQRGAAAVESLNVFHPYTYEGTVDLDSIEDPISRDAVVTQINNFGQCPQQILLGKHPNRNISELYGKKTLSQFRMSWCRPPITAKRIRLFHCPEHLHINHPETRQFPFKVAHLAFLKQTSGGAWSKATTTLLAVPWGQALMISQHGAPAEILSFEAQDGSVRIQPYADSGSTLRTIAILKPGNRVARYMSYTGLRKESTTVFLGTDMGHIDVYELMTVSQSSSEGEERPSHKNSPRPASRRLQFIVPSKPTQPPNTPHSLKPLSRSTADVMQSKMMLPGGGTAYRSLRYDGTLHGHCSAVLSMAYSKEWSLLASVSADGVACLWDTQSKRFLRSLGCAGQRVTLVALNEGNGDIATYCASDSTIHLWSFNGEILAISTPLTSPATCFCFGHSVLFVGTASGVIFAFDSFDLTHRATLEGGHTCSVTCLAMNDSFSRLATGDSNGEVLQWWLKTRFKEKKNKV